jgi:hypothetical protein
MEIQSSIVLLKSFNPVWFCSRNICWHRIQNEWCCLYRCLTSCFVSNLRHARRVQSTTRMQWFQGKPNAKMRSYLVMSFDESIAYRSSFLDHMTLLTSPQHAFSADHGPIASMKKSRAVRKGMWCQVSEMQFSCVTDSAHPTYNTENLLRYLWGLIVEIMGISQLVLYSSIIRRSLHDGCLATTEFIVRRSAYLAELVMQLQCTYMKRVKLQQWPKW